MTASWPGWRASRVPTEFVLLRSGSLLYHFCRMQSGNGIDLAAIHQLLTEVAQTVRGHSERFDRIDARFDRIDARLDGIDARLDRHERTLNELVVTVNDHTRKLDQLTMIGNDHTRKIDDVAAGLVELRSTVSQIHSAVIGHGLDIIEFSERLGRLERSSRPR
jgi:chromosome segregation ATPase